MELLIATRNGKKRREIEDLLSGLPVRVRNLLDFPDAAEVVEDAETLQGNAAKKAIETARACGMYTMADDSGLFVDALNGRPGVRSARYAGPDPTPEKLCRKLLCEMADVPDGQRKARFRCCTCMADPGGRVILTAEGSCEGAITREMAGEGGFGYDPVFFYERAGCTFAQMRPEDKHAVSHRGHALAIFRQRLIEWLGD
jgi:XTP/dITP diphosphohydrolase